MDKRPQLNKNISIIDFQDFYWLKLELTQFCKEVGLSANGNKNEITSRIIHYLKTGEFSLNKPKPKRKIESTFDWATEDLKLETLITDSYTNTENVRDFFKKNLGKTFKFNVKFMNWMKANSGKTLKEAIKEWHSIKTKDKSDTKPKEIAPQFEYNTYLRDFLVDNPNLKRQQGIFLWKKKKSMRGPNKYEKEDLKFLE